MITSQTPLPTARAELLGLIGRVRRRWRLRQALRGAAIALAVLLGWVVLGVALTGMLGQWPWAVQAVRIAGWIGLAAVTIRFLLLPLLRRVEDERVALYIEEHQPDLGALMVSAVQEARDGERGAGSTGLVELVVRDALGRLHAADDGRAFERPRLRSAGTMAGALATGLVVLTALGIGPFARARGLLLPWAEAVAEPAFAVLVEPGDVTVPRGGDQEIVARLRGFDAERVELLYRTGDDPEWVRVPMMPDDSTGTWLFRLFDLTEATEYVVESNGVRSRPHTISVSDLPAVAGFVVELRFPGHTGLPPETQDPGGDIVAPRGTTARFTVTPTMPASAGRLVTEQGDTVALATAEDGSLAGGFTLTGNALYRFELRAADGSWVEASLRYRVDVVDDRAPTVVIRQPGRDAQATSIEEVFTETEARDDFGIGRLELVYRVNGGEEQVIMLHDGGQRTPSELSAGHTLFLEEWGLEPGDLISYYGRATDNSPGPGQTVTSDIYFLRVRPFGRDYRQAEQQGQPGQGGMDSPEGLSERQRQVVAATFKVQRDQATAPEDRTREDLATLTLVQGGLRDRVTELVDQLGQRRAASVDSGFGIVHRELSAALPEMEAAERQLGLRDPGAALGPEQRALQHLQRAEEAFREVQVSMGGQGGGGQGGPGASAEDLADLFELETDKLRNQYEALQRTQEQQAEAQLDETLERLKQLASRQQQENDRMRRAADRLQQQARSAAGGGGGGGGAGATQRRMAAEAEEMARQLERLARDRDSPEAGDAARELRRAAEAMRRAATGQSGSESESESAAERLREAMDRLEQGRSNRLDDAIQDAGRRARDLAEREREIGRDVERALRNGSMNPATTRQLSERKDSLAAEVDRLEGQLDRLSREAGGERPETGRRLGEAAEGMRQDRVSDKVQFSKRLLNPGMTPDVARNFEGQIATNLDSAAARIGRAAEALGEARANDPSRALDQAGRLVRGLESLRDRAREQGAGGQEPGAGQQGPGGQPGGQGDRQGAAQPGAPTEGQPGGAGRPGWMDPATARQFSRELGKRRLTADSLLGEVERLGFDGGDLRDIVRELRALESGRLFSDPTGLERLERDVLERLKAFEFAFRRQVRGEDPNRPLIGASDEVPAKFRDLVEEYYRALARSQRNRPARPAPG